MPTIPSDDSPVKSPDHSLGDHTGIVRVNPDLVRAVVEIEFDPQRLSDNDVRALVDEHAGQVSAALQKSIFRLEGNACEACAQKLEKKITKIPGVRRASASYLGQVLTVTFDSEVSGESSMTEQVKRAGANIQKLPLRLDTTPLSLWKKIRSGELNEELSCGLGLLFLIVAFFFEKFAGLNLTTSFLYCGAFLFTGQQGVRSAIASLREKVLDVDVLMVLAALGAVLIGAPFEGALLLFLFSFSNVLQRHAMERTQRAIEALLSLRPNEALVKRGEGTIMVAVEDLEIGEIVIVRPGEQIPVDGLISEGSTNVDESSLTGE